MNIEYSTSAAVLLSLAIVAITTVLILIMRRHFAKIDPEEIAARHKDEQQSFSVATRNKYPELDVFAFRDTFTAFGLLAAIAFMIIAFGWTTYEKPTDMTALLGPVGDEIEMETPRTAEPPPPPPPPPPAPTAMQIVESEIPDIETIEFEDMTITEDTEIEGPVTPPKKEVAPPPPPPPPPPAPSKEIFRIVEEQPTFKGCENIMDKARRKKCADAKLMEFIYENIVYPAVARENNITGTVVVQFVVERDGSVSNVKLLRDIGGSCGEEAVRVVKMMPPWNPGKQRGRPVRVMFTLPIRFKLA